MIPFSLFRKQYPESKELILAFSVPKDVDPEKAKDEVTEAMRRVATREAQPGKRLRNHVARLPVEPCGRS